MEKKQQNPQAKNNYNSPNIDIFPFLYADIIITSANGDQNQGEWDSQTISSNITL